LAASKERKEGFLLALLFAELGMRNKNLGDWKMALKIA
jgi:hypothetical protein